ncbi:NAD(P)H-dependent oxidoreductase [Bombiscardovia coagulans]|uniref:NADPH dehydrogenase n=1 Tax=Bombiscardovia coagulans TaxID=686666 RepID=A0A261ET82_9BIFI|nr:NAD(P)H-dependent oxidoreductase [Bombiscardovia coagulans]OZG50069.1 NADPH dehydrogenase [Bombiscardovia coagulans]
MNILVIQGSPDASSFSHANAQAYAQAARRKGHTVEIIDLSQENFDPVLRFGYAKHMENESAPNRYQSMVARADHLVFVFPIWWAAEPAILKGWLDRVLMPQFAYRYESSGKSTGLLKGKTAQIISSSHAPAIASQMYGSTVTRWKRSILKFCGIRLTGVNILGRIDSKVDTSQRRETFIQDICNTIPTAK